MKHTLREVGGWGRVPFSRIEWALRPVINGTSRRGVGLIKWYSTPSPNLSPYIFLGLDPSPPPLYPTESKDCQQICTYESCLRVQEDKIPIYLWDNKRKGRHKRWKRDAQKKQKRPTKEAKETHKFKWSLYVSISPRDNTYKWSLYLNRQISRSDFPY